MKNKFEVIIFDLDDTLYKERDFVESGFKAVAKYVEENFEIPQKSFYKLIIENLNRKSRGKIFDDALKQYNIFNKSLVKKLIGVYRDHNPKIKVFPRVFNLLKSLRKNYKLALVTDGNALVQRRKVKTLGIGKIFDVIVFTDDFKKPKPSPFAFRKVTRFFRVKPGKVVYIADDPNKDFIGAKKLGVKTARVKQGRFSELQLAKKYEADYEIKNILELEKLLKKINF